ncbi:MAG: methylenetetrahydrofolate reductase [NAD(P)H] [Alphaproteobacteria bacterium]|nr:methylenetetrahydrofolate reductase [NAD(P)H] [Alphaproteobacteria bacterium]
MTAGPSYSFEIFPAKSPKAGDALNEALPRLFALKPAFLSVTYGAGGTGRDRSRELVDRLSRSCPVPLAAHLTCVGHTRAEIDALARRWWEAGVRRIVALRGDPPEGSGTYVPHPDGYENARALVEGLRRVADFDISVGAYPEVHPDSASEEADLDNLKAKLDAGAERAITQFFFEAEAFLRFRDRAAKAGIDKPILPGILPPVNFARACTFAETCGASIPGWLRDMFRGLEDDPETRAMLAVSVTARLCEQLMAEGVPHIHFYTLNRAEPVLAVCRQLAGPTWPAAA